HTISKRDWSSDVCSSDLASHAYFSKAPADLTLPEAALLAGLVQSPDTDNPVSGDRTAALARRTYVLRAMVRAKDIPAERADQVRSEERRVGKGETCRWRA